MRRLIWIYTLCPDYLSKYLEYQQYSKEEPLAAFSEANNSQVYKIYFAFSERLL